MDQDDNVEVVTPVTFLANELENANLSSAKPGKDGKAPLRVKFSLADPEPRDVTPLSVRNRIRPSKYNELLQSGLRVSTPPSRCSNRRFTDAIDENSPVMRSPSMYTVVVRQRNLMLEEVDSNAQDSPYSAFRFLPPNGFAPKKTDSPRRCLKFSSECLSTASTDSGISEDGWSELPLASDDESLSIPENLSTLLSASLSTPNRRKRKSSPPGSLAKRNRPLSDRASQENRSNSTPTKNKGTLFQYGFTKNKSPIVKETECEIKMALQRSTKEDLIGDLSKPHALPLLSPGKHIDLKSISSETLANLMTGGYDDQIASFKIIDCRYPYEFEGGHIKGAQNLYTCEDIRQELLKSVPPSEDESGKRNILIFHCEFSSERGPFLSRFLRKEDRNNHSYPNLAYPELYLLHGGYSNFFKTHKELCEPQSYRQMQDPAHSSELRLFKAKSKSWAPGNHKKLTIRSLSRLGF